MSFRLNIKHANHSDDPLDFEQIQDLFNHLNERVAQWNNFEVEKGLDWLEITITKPLPENTLGIHVNDKAPTSESIG